MRYGRILLQATLQLDWCLCGFEKLLYHDYDYHDYNYYPDYDYNHDYDNITSQDMLLQYHLYWRILLQEILQLKREMC